MGKKVLVFVTMHSYKSTRIVLNMRKAKLKKSSFTKNILILLVTHMIVKIIGVVNKIYLTNREGFGDEGNAIYSSAFQIYALFLTICSIGIPNAVSKLVSERLAIGDSKGAHKVFKIAVIAFGALGFTCSIILFTCAHNISHNWFQIPEAELSLVALSPSIFFVSITAVVRGYFNGRENISAGANSQTIEQIFRTVITIILIEVISRSTGTDTRIMAAGAAIATTMSEIICFTYLFKYYKSASREIANEMKNSLNYKYRGIRKTISDILAVSIPMSIGPILAGINKNIDSMTIVRGLKTFMTDSAAKLEYGMLVGKIDTLVVFPLSFNAAFTSTLIPMVAAAKASNNFAPVQRKIKFSLLTALLIGIPCTVGMMLFAKPILELLFPNQPDGANLLQISAISITFMMLSQNVNAILQGLGKTIIPTIGLIVGMAIKLALNLILVPINPNVFFLGGTNGAAFATVSSNIVMFVISGMFLKKFIKVGIQKRQIIKIGLATVMMAICTIFIYNSFLCIISSKLCIILALVFAVAIYLVLILILRVFSKEEIMALPYGNRIYRFLKLLKIYK